MPVIRLKNVIKDLNISLHRAVEFLEEKGITIDENPNLKIDPQTYEILMSGFQSDRKQKEASSEVVINKIPEKKPEPVVEKKPEPEVEEKPEIIKAKASIQKFKVIEKIDLRSKSEKEAEKRKEEERIQKVEEEKKLERKKEEEKLETANLQKEEPKSNEEKIEIEKPTTETVSDKKEEIQKEEIAAVQEKEKIEPDLITQKIEDNSEEKTEDVHKTVYQKLSGPKIAGEKIDLTQFKKTKKPSDTEKKKRKRINKGVSVKQENANRKPDPLNRNRNKPTQGQGNSRRNAPTPELTEEQVQKQIKETLEKLTSKGSKFSKGAKHRKDKRVERKELEAERQEQQEQSKTLQVTEFITVTELASLMDVAPVDVISSFFSLGVMVTMNQRLDAETLTLVAEEFGYTIEFKDAEGAEAILEEEEDNPSDLVSRAPIVTVMGHVDHGKTSLLDYVREANVIAGESGGITQHIGAYSVALEGGQHITFLDTPGHEAFTAMRARGTQVTDMAIIVIAADDEIKPQTKEAISHAQAAGVPMVFAINKIDRDIANPEKIKEQLAAMNLLVEDWGGTIQSQDISAKKGTNVDQLLEKILLEAEILELKANPKRNAQGVVIEAALDKGRGFVSTILVQKGTLKIGDYILAGKNHGKVKAMLDERGKSIKEAGPSVPVTVLGLDGAPSAGDKFRVFEDEREAKQLASKREQLQREQSLRFQKHITLDEIGRRIALGEFKELNIILKGDVDGSVEALSDSLQKLSTEEIHVNLLHKGVGQITESDVLLASASDAIVIGFNVRPGVSAKAIAEKEEIEIRTYSIIYDAINEVQEAMEGLLSPEIKEEVIGNVEIRETFKISKVGTIAGCMVTDGKIKRTSKIRLIREGIVQHDGELESLKRFKDDVKEVTKGFECGLNIKGYNNIEVGDTLEVYEEVQVKKKLK